MNGTKRPVNEHEEPMENAAEKTAVKAARPARGGAGKKPAAARKPAAAKAGTAGTSGSRGRSAKAAGEEPSAATDTGAAKTARGRGRNVATTANSATTATAATAAGKRKTVRKKAADGATDAVALKTDAMESAAEKKREGSLPGQTVQAALQTEAASQANDAPTSLPTAPAWTDAQGEQARESLQEEAPAYDFGAAEAKLMCLQQKIRALKIPVVILLEGWSAAGKGTMAGELLEGLDPRGYKVCVNERFPKEEDGYPYLHRYWVNMPRQGNITLFIGSWYEKLCRDVVKGKDEAKALLEKAKSMEEMLGCDGVVLLKFFLHISKKEQKRRLTELERKKRTCKLACKADWEQNEEYSRWAKAYERVRKATDLPGQEWHMLSGEDKKACKQALYETVIAAFESAIAKREAGERNWDAAQLRDSQPVEPAIIQHLQAFEPSQALDEDYKSSLNAAQKKLRKLQYEMFRAGIPMVIAFEGWDAAGKGGAIRRLTSAMDPRGFTVEPISAPTAEEKEHHHLWRFWTKLPFRGEVRIFDRTWYGRVMVERIEGFCTEHQWMRAYDEINLFEKELLDAGTVICKFWLQIDNEEQLKRFNAREKSPEKQWKITQEDWRNREKWPQYETAVDEMLQRTNTEGAPWTVVEANNKQYARIKVLHTVIAAMEKALKK